MGLHSPLTDSFEGCLPPPGILDKYRIIKHNGFCYDKICRAICDMKLYQSLGYLIKDYRQWRGLSQERFAESIGLSVRELQRWETDRRRARTENLHDLSETTGIPMQVWVMLNADQPVWYSLRNRLFTYDSIGMAQYRMNNILKCHEQSDEGVLTKNDRITTDKHISMISSCHQEIYGTEKPLRRDVIKKAIKILPDLNCIVFDFWGHYVGHHVCLPIKKEVYEQIKKEKAIESYLTSDRISDITDQHEGVFFNYSIFAANPSIAHSSVINCRRYFATIEQKGRYLVVGYSPIKEIKENFSSLGMRKVRNTKDDVHKDTEVFPEMYEIELDVLMRPLGAFGGMSEEYAQKQNDVSGIRKKYFSDKMPGYNSLVSVDKSLLLVDKEKRDDPKGMKIQIVKLETEACPNRKCNLRGKVGEDNVVSNGTYRTKEGSLFRRFLCKECGKSFCSRSETLFYGLRSPEEKILMALKLLVKGMPLQGVAKVLGAAFNTVRHWLKVASEKNGKIDAMLMKELKVSQVELDDLWTFVKKNSLRRRAILWKGRESG
jgi:transcriptional regulator with XRE-family HTH domain/transposase-like protein